MEVSTPPVQLSPSVPQTEATGGAAGASAMASDAAHTHPSISSRHRVVLDAAGQIAVTYKRTFPTKPAIVLTAINPSGGQVALEVVSDTLVGGVYVGCVIKGARAQPLPNIAVVSGLLTAVITGVNSIVSALTGFNVYGGSAAGVEVSVVAIMPSN